MLDDEAVLFAGAPLAQVHGEEVVVELAVSVVHIINIPNHIKTCGDSVISLVQQHVSAQLQALLGLPLLDLFVVEFVPLG